MFKKTSHCLFVEEETYNWANPGSSLHKPLSFLAVAFVVGGLFFGVLV